MTKEAIFKPLLMKGLEILLYSTMWSFILLMLFNLKTYQYFLCGVAMYFFTEELHSKITQYLFLLRGNK